MIPGVRLWLLLVTLMGLLIARAAPADEGIARRLAALQMLTNSQLFDAAPPASAAAKRGRGSCAAGDSGWWRHSAYAERDRIHTAVRDASIRYRVERRLIESVIRVESNYDVDAVSHKGAMGLMQLMPGTARELGVLCAFDPRANVLGGARYLRRLRDRLGSWPRALAGYHAGPSRVERGRVPTITHRYVANVMRRWRPGADASIALESPPLRPTRR